MPRVRATADIFMGGEKGRGVCKFAGCRAGVIGERGGGDLVATNDTLLRR